MSVRAAALRCAVPRATWAAWESGRTAPTTSRLDRLLTVLALDLRLVDRQPEPAGEDRVRRHLRASLTQRARWALADQLDAVVAACCERPRLLSGPAAVGVWVPYVVARGPLPLPSAPAGPDLVRLRLDLGFGRAVRAAVATPSALVASGAAEQWPALLTSLRLLRTEAPRDMAERKLPAHRDPDEDREMHDLSHTLTWGGRGLRPVSAQDSRAWRLDAPASLDEALLRQRLPPRHPRP